jgi:hypothetical protein
MAEATAEVSARACRSTLLVPPRVAWGGHTGRTPTMPSSLEAVVSCGTSGSGPHRLRSTEAAMSLVTTDEHRLAVRLVSGVR